MILGEKIIRNNNYEYLDTVKCYSMKIKLKILFRNTFIMMENLVK